MGARVSFDISFGPQPGGAADPDDLSAMPSQQELEVWQRIEAHTRSVLGHVESFRDERSWELTDEETAIQVHLFPREIALTVPYWYEGDDAVRITALLQRLAQGIEAASGWQAWDPQADAPFLAGDEDGTSRSLGEMSRFVRGLPLTGSEDQEKKVPWWRRSRRRPQP